jgi:hypothetical protein
MLPERRKTLIEINHFCFTSSILIINPSGKLQLVNCPMKVILIADPEVSLYVEEIKTNPNLELLYLIQGKLHSHSLFEIE